MFLHYRNQLFDEQKVSVFCRKKYCAKIWEVDFSDSFVCEVKSKIFPEVRLLSLKDCTKKAIYKRRKTLGKSYNNGNFFKENLQIHKIKP